MTTKMADQSWSSMQETYWKSRLSGTTQ